MPSIRIPPSTRNKEDFSLSTKQIQQALDTCHHEGGGVVRFMPGVHCSGTLFLRSGVAIVLEPGGILKASPRITDYAPNTHWQRYANEAQMDPCFLYAEDCRDISITGGGTIDGSGAAFPNARDARRPMLLRCLRCEGFRLEQVTLQHPAAWSTAFIECDGVFARGLRIHSRANLNGDGLDFDACRDVTVADCQIDASDDCICLQNSTTHRPCRRVTISNCILKSQWAAIRIGLLSSGNIEDVTINNCCIADAGCSGVKIQSCEGGDIRNIAISNLVMHNVPRPFFITANITPIGRNTPEPVLHCGTISDITTSNLRICNEEFTEPDSARFEGIVIDGSPHAPIRSIRHGAWKLIHYPKINRTQLFDLSEDPAEGADLLASWRLTLAAPRDTANHPRPDAPCHACNELGQYPLYPQQQYGVADLQEIAADLSDRLREWLELKGDPCATL